MKNMIKEKKTLLILRVVFGVLLLAGIVCSILVYRHFDARIVDDTGYADDYNPVPAPAPATNNNTEAPANDADSTANNGENL
mgnify:CR=1 FL=1